MTSHSFSCGAMSDHPFAGRWQRGLPAKTKARRDLETKVAACDQMLPALILLIETAEIAGATAGGHGTSAPERWEIINEFAGEQLLDWWRLSDAARDELGVPRWGSDLPRVSFADGVQTLDRWGVLHHLGLVASSEDGRTLLTLAEHV